MTTAAHQIELCLARLGTDSFAQAFCDLVETLSVDQIMVFAIGAGGASCLLSRHFSHGALGDALAAQYLDGWYNHDPLLPALRAADPDTVTLHRVDDMTAQMSDEYRHIFFDAPGLHAKTTLLGVGQALKLFVSLYQTGAETEPPDPDLSRLVGRLALLHFEQKIQTAEPAVLDVLSARERAVCLGILAGRKAELIAGDIDVAASTVVTYRKRAYAKLGINSRAALFAICQTQDAG